MKERIELQNTYVRDGHKFSRGLARPNVRDLVNLDEETEQYIESKYGQRSGHIPRLPEGSVGIEGILIQDPSKVDPKDRETAERGYDNAAKQLAYLGELAGDSGRFKIFTPEKLKEDVDAGEEVVIAPYLYNGKLSRYLAEHGLDKPNVTVSGLHPDVVSELKSKTKFHDLAREAQDPEFAVPHHTIVPVSEIPQAGKALIAFTDELYEAIDEQNYPVRIFGRLEYSDGGFGSFNLKRGAEGYHLDTGGDKHPIYPDLDEALDKARDALKKSSRGDDTTKVVLSRGLDLIDTPGLSMFFADGQAVPLGFNGQILDADSKACVGTSNYEPSDPRLKHVQKEYEERTAAAAINTVHKIARAKGIEVTELRGFGNVDTMILGPRELAVQKKVTDAMRNGSLPSSLLAKLEQYGQLKDPASRFLAESNPRRTNMIEALDEVVLVEGHEQNVKAMRAILENGIRAEDNYQLPPGVDVDKLAEALGETYAKDVRTDGLVILRTRPIEPQVADKPSFIGVIMTGDIAKRKDELQAIVDNVRKR